MASSQTISKTDYIGHWQEHYGLGVTGAVNSLRSSTITTISFAHDFTVNFKRKFESGNIQEFTVNEEGIEFKDEFIIIPFSMDSKILYKLILSGWHNNGNKLIFGTLYLFDNGELFNGIPISFKPKNN